MRSLRVSIALCLSLILSIFLSAQQSSSSPSLTTEVPNLVVITGNATWKVGSTSDTGTLTLRVTSDGGIEEHWRLSNAQHGFKRAGFHADSECQSVDESGTATSIGDQRCLRTVPWFAPWLALKLVADGSSAESDVTTDADRAAGQQKLAFTEMLPSLADLKPKTVKMLNEQSRRSALQLTYDLSSLSVIRMDYSDHPDSDSARKIDTYVLYGDYRMEQGVMMPHRIQRFVQRTLQLDFQVTSVSTN